MQQKNNKNILKKTKKSKWKIFCVKKYKVLKNENKITTLFFNIKRKNFKINILWYNYINTSKGFILKGYFLDKSSIH